MEYTTVIKDIYKSYKQIQNEGLIEFWKQWLKGFDPKFHNYNVYNGKQKIKRTKKSLKMFKKVCEDWASLLFNEKTDIVVRNQNKFYELADELALWEKGNQAVESGFGLSMCGLVLNIKNLKLVKDKGGVNRIEKDKHTYLDLQLISAEHIIPLNYRGKEITECAFIEMGKDTANISIHELLDDGTYKITILVVDNKSKQIHSQQELYTQCKTPLYLIVSPNIMNNLDVESPLPISVCANSIDICKHIDDIFDSYNNEFILGKKRTYVSAKLNTISKENGEVETTFDPEDMSVYVLPETETPNGAETLIKNVSDSLRTTEHQVALKDALNLLSASVGLGVEYYNFEKGRVMTATQVISEKSDTFRNLRKHEILLEARLIPFVQSIMTIYNLFIEEGTFEDIENVSIKFDDSIIEDKATEKENDKRDVELGVMSKVAYRMKWYGEDEKTATKNVKAIYGDADLLARLNHFTPFLTQGTITVEDFVDNVYPKAKNRDELIAKIGEAVKSAGSITADDLFEKE